MSLGRSCRAVLPAVLAACAIAPAVASAQCPKGAQCGRLTVALDHSGRTAGTLPLAYARVPATGTRTGTIVLLSGGPGQAAVPLTTAFSALLEDLRGSYDIVTVDQRGTGASGAVACDITERADAAACGRRLGDRRAFFSTPETAHDLEDLRVALGVPKLTLLGVSYGAKVAGEYARRYPASTAALVLDSPTPVDGLDGTDQLRTLGAPRVLREVCFPGLCSRTVTDPDEALAAAASRLQDGALRGPLVSPSGRVRTERVRERDLYTVLSASDLSPGLRAGLPAAIASLAAGDAAPLLHLVTVVPAGDGDAGEINSARLLATACIESRLPWAPDSPVASRADALRAFVAERMDEFAPFSPETVLGGSITQPVRDLAADSRARARGVCGPGRPGARAVGPRRPAHPAGGRAPDGAAVPEGHGPRGARRRPLGPVLRRFRLRPRRRASRSCAAAPSRSAGGQASLPAAPYAPATLAGLRPTSLPGVAGRTISAVGVTLTGIGFDTLIAGSRGTVRLPGLRAGWVRASRQSLELHGVEWIRGVRVSGRLDSRGRGKVTVSGRAAAPGTITFSRSGGSGVIGGRSFTFDR